MKLAVSGSIVFSVLRMPTRNVMDSAMLCRTPEISNLGGEGADFLIEMEVDGEVYSFVRRYLANLALRLRLLVSLSS